MTEPNTGSAYELALVRAVLADEEPAIEEFSHRLECVPRILSAQNARFGRPLDEHDLADVVQDTIVIILQKLRLFRGEGPLEGWIFRICCLEYLNSVRRRRRRKPVVDVQELPVPDAQIAKEERQMQDRETLYKALERLDPIEADAVRMKHFEGLTFEQMAERTGVSANTMKTRYYRGLERLEGIVGKDEGTAQGT